MNLGERVNRVERVNWVVGGTQVVKGVAGQGPHVNLRTIETNVISLHPDLERLDGLSRGKTSGWRSIDLFFSRCVEFL